MDFYRFDEILSEEKKRRVVPIRKDTKRTIGSGYWMVGSCAKCGQSINWKTSPLPNTRRRLCSKCELEALSPEEKERRKKMMAKMKRGIQSRRDKE